MPAFRKTFTLLLSICFFSVLFADQELPILGKLIERNGRLYDTFYYHMDGEPQYLLQKYDEIAIPHSVDLNSLRGLEFNGIQITDMISEVTFDVQNFRAFKINLDEFDRNNWFQVRNILAKNGIAAWPVLTYHADDAPVVLDGTMNIVFTKYTSREEQEETLELFGLKVVEIDEDLNFYMVSLPAGSDPFAIANALFERRLVRWAQPNWIWHFKPLSTTPDDTYFSQQWHLTQINAPEAWDTETAANKDVRIAIVDTGVDLNHPDLNVLSNLGKDFIGNLGGAPNVPTYGGTQNGGKDHEGVPHGTACAGLAAAKTNNGLGVSASCWGCPIIPIRLIVDDYSWTSGQSTASDATLQAMKYAVDNGAWVVSNSWGAQDVDRYGNCTGVPADNNSSQGVDYGRNNGRNGKGTIFLWAAGNSHCNTNQNKFLQDNDFLTISALGQSGSLESYSNYGTEIDISAGAGNNTTDIQGKTYGYAYNGIYSLDNNGDYTSGMNGTSAATPVAAGAVALMLAANPALTFSGAMNCIKSSARKPSNACSEGSWTMQQDEHIEAGSKEHSPCYGFGIVDANAMVVGAKNGTCGECVATSSVDGCFGNYYDKDDDCDGVIDNNCPDNAKGRTGDACSAASDCINTATNPKCITDEGWNGGYCSAECTKNNDCYNGNSKVECYQGQCIAKCSYNTVRSGYACISNKILPKGTETVANCGNDVKEEGEKCDGGYKSCKSIDDRFTGGIAYCNKTCNGYDTSTCEGGGGVLCGNNNIDPGEVCDGDTIQCSQLAGAPENGTAKCALDCLSWDKSGCYNGNNNDNGSGNNDSGNSSDNGGNSNDKCGNGLIDPGEQCDDGNRIDGDGCSGYCMKESDSGSSSSGCSVTVF
ncbi:S8 family serine peptidase [bacterium]|nr:S8 family serine peptidase [bacterium]